MLDRMAEGGEDLNQKIHEAIDGDTTLGCGPASWTTGKADPFYRQCVAHDEGEDAIRVGDLSLTFEQNDQRFYNNIDRRVRELIFLHPHLKEVWVVWGEAYKELVRVRGEIVGK